MKKLFVLLFAIIICTISVGLVGCNSYNGGSVYYDNDYVTVERTRLSLGTKKLQEVKGEVLTKLSEVNGKKQKASETVYNDGGSYVDLIVLVPNDKTEEFINYVESIDSVNLDYKNVYTYSIDDKSDEIDIKIEALEKELELLESTLEKENKVEIIKEIANVKIELGELNKRLADFETVKGYSEISLYIYEEYTDFTVFWVLLIFLAFVGLGIAVIILAVRFSQVKTQLKVKAQYDEYNKQRTENNPEKK